VEVFDQKVEGPSNYHRTVSRGVEGHELGLGSIRENI
jgi:hypothetical protein